MVKVISAISKEKMGEIILRAMPVKEDDLTEYIKFINE